MRMRPADFANFVEAIACRDTGAALKESGACGINRGLRGAPACPLLGVTVETDAIIESDGTSRSCTAR
jgi:hypothetical protein